MHLLRRDERRRSMRGTAPRDASPDPSVTQLRRDSPGRPRSSEREGGIHHSMVEFAMKFFRYERGVKKKKSDLRTFQNLSWLILYLFALKKCWSAREWNQFTAHKGENAQAILLLIVIILPVTSYWSLATLDVNVTERLYSPTMSQSPQAGHTNWLLNLNWL